MILLWLILTPLIGGVLAGFTGRRNNVWPRWLSLACLAIDLVMILALWATHYGAAVTPNGTWLAQIDWPWIPQLGIRLQLGLDGLSLLLILLTLGLGVMSVIASWSEITERVGFFHFNLMLTLAGVIGVFLALDLFLFFFFWELMLVPMYFLIAVWGHERRIYAAIKFFLFTQGSGLLM
ncbi:proton-conducting transporter membrane subunit, partial [Bradyrhizobium sp.]|uniref:proton-conducting transporter transmembrane domain-containing protein n=1 Tax=Bradyrhizobium sp. TaxID=376 RepID=UPI003C525617